MLKRFISQLKYSFAFIPFLLLTACGVLPTKTGGDVHGNVESLTNVSYSMPPYVFWAMAGLIVVLIAVIFLFIKSPLQR
tara:strand:- start:228 stop:464 length:237 start_codon:yes stop_codon:yes gene_type:complete